LQVYSWRRTFPKVPRAVPRLAVVVAVLIGVQSALADDKFATLQSLSGVYVNESVEAQRQLQRIAQLQASEHWEDAARAFERLLTEHGQTVVRTDINRYISVVDYIHDQFAHWPRTAAAYASLFAKQAEEALEALGALGEDEDTAILHDIVDRYWPTSAGGVAAERLGRRLLESGAALDAGRIFERLSREHPDYREYADAAVFAALAYAKADRHDLSKTSADLARRLGGEVMWQGRLRSVAEVLAEIQSAARLASPQPSDWPMLGGDVSRNRLSPVVPDPDLLLWRVDLEAKPHSRRPMHKVFPCEPIIVGDRVYVQDAYHIWSIDLNTGWVVWRYEFKAPRDDMVSSARTNRRPRAPTLSEGRLYAVVGEVQPARFLWESASGSSVLICLDPADGTERWRVAAPELFGVSDRTGYFFDSSPLVRFGAAHLVVQLRRRGGYEECYLAGIDAATGRPGRVVYLAGALTQPSHRNPLVGCEPTADGDSIYVQTHLGAVACVSSTAGRIRWLTLDDQPSVAQSPLPPDSLPATTASHWLRIIQPADSGPKQLLSVDPRDRSLSVYRPEDGRKIRCVSARQLAEPASVLGPFRNVAYSLGKQLVAYDLDQNQILWRVDMPPSGGARVTSDRLYFSMSGELRWLDLKGNPKGTVKYPVSLEGPVDVTTAEGVVLVSGQRRLLCYTQRAARLARIEERIAEQPDDPSGLTSLAWLAFRDFNDASRALLAIDKVLKISEAGQAESKRQIFDLIIRIVQQRPALADGRPLKKWAALVSELLHRAERSAGGLQEQIRYRMLFADVFERFGQPTEAIRLCQSILDDRSLRAYRSVACDEPAGEAARRRISEWVGGHGRGTYAQYDKAADELYRAGRSQHDEQLLWELAEQYPNAHVVPDVVLDLGELRRVAGQPLPAVVLLRRFWFERLDLRDGRSADLLAMLARCCFEAGLQREGLLWLARGMKAFPEARVTFDGRTETFAAHYRRPVDLMPAPGLLSLSLPLQFAYRIKGQGRLQLIPPSEGSSRAEALMFDADGLVRLDPRTGETSDGALWPTMKEPPRWLGVVNGQLLLATPFQILAVDERTGERRWSFGQRPWRVDAAATDPEIVSRLTESLMAEDLLLGVYDDGRAFALRARDGRVLWQKVLVPKLRGPLALNGETLILSAVFDGKEQLVVLDARTGERRRTIDTDEIASAQWLRITPARTVIAVGTVMSFGKSRCRSNTARRSGSPGSTVRTFT